MNEVVINNYTMPVINGCDFLAASEPFFHSDRILDFNVLIYVAEGVICVTEEDIDYEIGTGELLFLKKGCHHYGKKEIPKGTRWYFIHFYSSEDESTELFCPDSSFPEPYKPIRNYMLLPKTVKNLSGSVTEKKIRSIIDYYYSADSMKEWEINRRLWELLGDIAMQNMGAGQTGALSDRICDHLKQNYREKFSASSLEKKFFLSYKHMASVFRKDKGISMQQYHNRIRMEEAARLLRSSLMSVGEISDSIGFTDMLYFSRCFRSYYLVSPTEYRKNSKDVY